MCLLSIDEGGLSMLKSDGQKAENLINMKNNLYFAVLATALVGTIFLQACNSDDSDTPSTGGVDLVTAKNWKMVSSVISITTDNALLNAFLAGNTEMDLLEDQEACAADDVMIFNADGTFTDDDQTETCTDFEASTGTWSANADVSTFTIVFDSQDVGDFDFGDLDGNTLFANLFKDMKVDKLSATEFDLSQSVTETVNIDLGTGTPISADVTFSITMETDGVAK